MTRRHPPEEHFEALPLFDVAPIPFDANVLIEYEAERTAVVSLETPPESDATIRDAFEKFHAVHPEVYRLFERFALEAINAGFESFGAKAIWERMRWETQINSPHCGEFKLNNNFTAYYSRLFMDMHPEHSTVFETRSVRA